MSSPWQQDAYGLDDDDFIEGADDEQEELGIDYTARRGGAAPLQGNEPTPVAERVAVRRTTQTPSKAARVRPMSATMAARNADVCSILVTKYDGTQTLFVRR